MERAAIRGAGPGDAADISHVHVASWRTTYRSLVPDAFLDGMPYEGFEARCRERLEESSQNRVFFVAEVSGGMVGFASGGPRRSESLPEFDGELHALYLPAEARGTGIGRGLFETVAERLSALRFTSMLAWVMAENRPARGFYEAFGGKLVGRDTFEIEGVEIKEVVYGWDDVRGLVEALA